MEKPRCELCKSEMELVEKKSVVGTVYHIWKCNKCRRNVAKSAG